MSGTDQPGPADALACASLLARFAHCVDSRDYAALLELVSPDCIWRGPKDAVGRAAILERLNARPQDMATLHVVTNVAVDFDGADSAHSRSYVTVYRHDGAGAPPYPLAGPHTVAVYDDRFVRIGGKWLISERRMTPFAQVPPASKE
jgi:hypothetical protein